MDNAAPTSTTANDEPEPDSDTSDTTTTNANANDKHEPDAPCTHDKYEHESAGTHR
jgi:hypothetical protein